MIKVAIVENNKEEKNRLKFFITKYGERHEIDFSVCEHSSGEEFFAKKNNGYDLIFLDIMLSGMDGIKIAKKIRESDKNVIIVFITAVSNLAVEGYTVGALDYVIKPVDMESLSFTMERAIKIIEQKTKIKIGVNSASGIQILSSDEITYVEVFGHNIVYHLGKENRSVSEWAPLSKPEKLLSPHGFFRCSKYYLVNLKYIEDITDTEVFVCGNRLTLSKSKATQLKQILNYYLSV